MDTVPFIVLRFTGGMLLFITRKFPPAVGGMEEFSAQLAARYPGPLRLVALRRGQRWLPLFLARAALACLRHRGRAEVVHLGDALLAPAAPLFARLAGAPVTVTLHGQDVTRPFPGYAALLRPALRALGDGQTVAVSTYTAAETARRFGVHPRVIPNGVDRERFSSIQPAADPAAERRTLGLPAHGPLVVTVGRLVPRKAAAWFAANVLPLLPPDVTFAVVGSGPEEAALRRIAAREPRLRLLGPLPGAAVERLYACADLFVAPNVPVPGRPEGFGIAPAEAAAAGLPVLAAALEGLIDMATVCGARLVPPADPNAWAAAVREALASPRPPRPRVRSWDDVAADYQRLFEAVARRARANRPVGSRTVSQ
ncbi:glycosyltransferase family 4 protein [Tepidiforma sp.]|uniref:glycosyltransferase family 4 protein n=1 Tax=Tepidiforma sp. TaxID=2682230 RepID=UPI002ADD43AF|nr:glycosyltransferase family 4 protein [Tepidiforma sp.]